MLRRLALAAAATALMLATCELALRVLAPPPLPGTATTDAPKAALYGWAWPPDFRFRAVDPDTHEPYDVTTNSEGWKDVEHTRAKPAGSYRILVLGDSNTFGFVPIERLYTRRLEALLHERGFTRVEVISIGVGGWGTDQELEALVREGVDYRPDLVIYQFCGNDVLNNVSPNGFLPAKRIEWAKRFRYELGADGALRRVELTPRQVDEAGDRLRRALRRTAIGGYLAPLWASLRGSEHEAARRAVLLGEAVLLDPGSPYFLYSAGPDSPELAEAWRLLDALVVRMRDTARAAGAAFAVFSEEGEPGKRAFNLRFGRVHHDDRGDYVERDGLRVAVDWRAPLGELRAICDRDGIDLIAPTRTYERFRNDPHPDRAGNEAMAEDLADWVEGRLGGG